MKADTREIEYLSKGLRQELTAVNQLRRHSRTWAEWCCNDVARKWHGESTEEREQADRLMERIIFLKHTPNLQELSSSRIGKSIRKILENGVAVEYNVPNLYQETARYRASIGDRVSKDLFEELMTDEECHIDLQENQLTLIGQIGSELYAQKHIGEPGKGEGYD